MITLFDQQEVISDYIASDRREQAEIQAEQTAKRLRDRHHMSEDDIADIVGYSVQKVRKWLGLVPQA